MKLSINWLKDFVDFIEKDPRKIAERLTVSTAEVEGIEDQGALLTNCCIGKLVKLLPHPNADKLKLCDVKTDRGIVRVVCGGTNLREGMRVAFAHIGAKVKWHGEEMMTLEKAKIRGEESSGVICAADELGLSSMFPEASGGPVIIDLGDGEEGVGMPLKEYLNCADTVLDINNTAIANRPDLFSHLGFARELKALGFAKWRKDRPQFKDYKFPSKKLPFKVIAECRDLIPRYFSCLLEIGGTGETPDWMVRRLEAVGFRSLNLPVDITNYVLAETGMPLHCFDADDIKGDVRMRLSGKGERIVTLDEKERELPEGSIVLSDDDGIFDLLGVMGGLRSSTKASTRRIYLHSALADPVTVRRAIIGSSLRTSAATIYEKGIPNVTVRHGFNRALGLFLKLVPGARIVSSVDSWGSDGEPKPIKLSSKRVSEFLGDDIPARTTRKILKDLEFDVKGAGDDLTVTPPLHRLGDIKGPHDLIEEVGRIYRYDNIAEKMPYASIEPPPRDQRVHIIRDVLKESGFMEIVPLSLVGSALLEKCGLDPSDCIGIENSLGEETSLMQPHVLPGLLEHAEKNLLYADVALRTFHWGQIFDEEGEYENKLGALIASRTETGIEDDPFLVLKSAIKHALKSAGYPMRLLEMKDSPPYAHPGRNAHIFAGEEMIGEIYEVHPSVRANFDLPHRSAALSISLSKLMEVEPETVTAKPLPQFPAVTYDVTIPFSQNKSVGELVSKIKKTSNLLESVEVAKLYARNGIQQYNLTLRCTYRAQDRTLTDEEAKNEHKAVLAIVN